MKIEKKEYHGLPYEEVDNFYVRMDKVDFDMMTRYFDAVQKNAEASSKLIEALSEKIEALTEQNKVLKTMLMMKEPKEENGSMKILCPTDDINCPYCSQGYCTMKNPWDNCYDYRGCDPCIGCPNEGHGSEHCAAVIGDYCRAGHGFIEDEED